MAVAQANLDIAKAALAKEEAELAKEEAKQQMDELKAAVKEAAAVMADATEAKRRAQIVSAKAPNDVAALFSPDTEQLLSRAKATYN